MRLARPFTGRTQTITRSLYVAFELGDRSWKLSLGDAVRAPSRCTVAAGDTAAVFTAIARAKVRCRLAADAPVRSCYEAGRDGFWLPSREVRRGSRSISDGFHLRHPCQNEGALITIAIKISPE